MTTFEILISSSVFGTLISVLVSIYISNKSNRLIVEQRKIEILKYRINELSKDLEKVKNAAEDIRKYRLSVICYSKSISDSYDIPENKKQELSNKVKNDDFLLKVINTFDDIEQLYKERFTLLQRDEGKKTIEKKLNRWKENKKASKSVANVKTKSEFLTILYEAFKHISESLNSKECDFVEVYKEELENEIASIQESINSLI